jgi:eukaryotic-like serine/threonine-protein kinase
MPGSGRALNERKPGRLIGGYRLEALLGRGGMAEVWRATLTGPARFARTVAVKRILPHLLTEPHIVRMFGKEAATAGLLHHQNIVQIYELVEADGELLIVMEFVPGADMLTLIKKSQGKLPLGFALHVVRELCRGLHHAHSLCDSAGKPIGIVHRDVSHANVLVGWDGSIKLSDFGVAKVLSHATAATRSEIKGKTGYMSPEQATGERMDHRADVFSVGVVLYELCTGASPWTSPTGSLALRQGARITPPTQLVPGLPPELDAICLRAMSDQPGDRFADCDQLAAAIAPLADAHRFGAREVAHLCSELVPIFDRAPTAETQEAVAIADEPARPRGALFIALALGLFTVALAIMALFYATRTRDADVAAPAPAKAPELPEPPVVAAPPPPTVETPAEQPPAAVPAKKMQPKKKDAAVKKKPEEVPIKEPLWDPFGK